MTRLEHLQHQMYNFMLTTRYVYNFFGGPNINCVYVDHKNDIRMRFVLFNNVLQYDVTNINTNKDVMYEALSEDQQNGLIDQFETLLSQQEYAAAQLLKHKVAIH